MDDYGSLEVVVRNREGVVFSGNVFAVSSVNDVGPFDILSGHANFICTIKDKIVIHKTKHEKQEIVVESGILRVKDNKIEAYLGI